MRRDVNALSAEGTWPDLDYTSRQRSLWPTALHLNRVEALARAYAAPGHELRGDATVREAIDRGVPTSDIKPRNGFITELSKILGY